MITSQVTKFTVDGHTVNRTDSVNGNVLYSYFEVCRSGGNISRDSAMALIKVIQEALEADLTMTYKTKSGV